MIILGTNVLSGLVRPNPEKSVVQWIARHPLSMLFTTAVTRAELLYGVYLLPDGRRKATSRKVIETILDVDMDGKILNFNAGAANWYATISAARKTAGKPIDKFDAMIAAITKSHDARLATRNVKDFTGCEIDIINPWTS